MNEQLQYEIAQKWLYENGNLTNSFIESKSIFKIKFKMNDREMVREGTDLKRLTIQLYNEINA